MIATAKRAPRIARPFLFLSAIAIVLLFARETGPVQAAQSAGTQALVPIQRLIAEGGRSTSRFFDAIAEIDRLRTENARLRTQVDALTLENIALRERTHAAEQAAKLQRVAASLGGPAVGAQVIGRDPAGFIRSLTLDAGSEAGVAVGNVVVAEQGVVGRIVEAGPNFSRVAPITDSSSAIIATVQRTRATGILRGQFGDTLVLEWVLQSEDVREGDVVLTAGLALSDELRSRYPKGLVLGTVADVRKADVLAYQRAVVRPAVDVRRLERVLVVKGD